jgi:hypothetical protein
MGCEQPSVVAGAVAELVAAATNTTTGAVSPCAAATPPPRAGREIGDSTGDPNPMTSTTRSATQFADSRSNRKPIAQKKFEAIFLCGIFWMGSEDRWL